jgi:hypothetical protein
MNPRLNIFQVGGTSALEVISTNKLSSVFFRQVHFLGGKQGFIKAPNSKVVRSIRQVH